MKTPRTTGRRARHCFVVIASILAFFPTAARGQNEEKVTDLLKTLSTGYTFEMDTEIENPNDCPEGMAITKNHQRWLFTSYRGLYEYRRTYHPYMKFAEKGDATDSASKTGSVVLLNFQESLIHLACPCKGKVKEWRMYGRHSKKFNDYKIKSVVMDGKQMLVTAAPAQRNYYRTYSCHVGRYIHYFNVFTRPLALTSLPPLVFTEGVSGPSDAKKQVDCQMVMHINPEKKPNLKYGYVAAPYQFYWQFPPEDIKKKELYTERHQSKNRPPIDVSEDNLYWEVNTDPSDETKTFPAHKPNSAKWLIVMKAERIVSDLEVCKLNTEKDDRGQLKHEQTVSKMRYAISFKLTSNYAVQIQAGTYSCVVVDGNGLSSAFWWDGDKPPLDRFRGNTRIRVRSKFYIYLGTILFALSCGIVCLMIFILPDNTEDFDGNHPEEPLENAAELDKENPSAGTKVSAKSSDVTSSSAQSELNSVLDEVLKGNTSKVGPAENLETPEIRKKKKKKKEKGIEREVAKEKSP